RGRRPRRPGPPGAHRRAGAGRRGPRDLVRLQRGGPAGRLPHLRLRRGGRRRCQRRPRPAGERYYPVAVETVSTEVAAGVARHLSPVVDAGVPIDDDSDLPRAISYLKLAGTQLGEDPGHIIERWKENNSLTPRDGSAPQPRKHDSNLRGLI